MKEAKTTVKLQNEVGLHARPASTFVQMANQFDQEIKIEKIDGDEGEVNAKSIIKVLSIGAEKNDKIIIRVKGDNPEEVLKKMISLVKNNFEE